MSCLKYKTLLICCLCAWAFNHVQAQSNGTNSSYSRFGLGLPTDQSQSFNRSMGGVAQGLRSSYRINLQNPASYSAIDSLTFIFDVGLSVQRTFMKQDGMSKTLNNTSFDFVNAAFRLRKNLGMSLGFVPYTRIGYSFYTDKPAKNDATIITHQEFKSSDTSGTQTTGGLHQAYIGAGWEPLKGFSIGANFGILWGNINHYMQESTTQNGATLSADNIRVYDTSSLFTWKGDVGV